MAGDELAIEGGESVREEPLDFATPVLGDDEVENVADALRSGWLTTGGRVDEFESAVADRTDAGHAIGTTNCTSALYLSYRALDVEGEVITTPLTFATTVSSAMQAGATPVLADVRPDTLTLDPESVKEAITDETDAIVPVHYAGQATDMDVYRDLAEDHDLALIEDAAHGLGGSFEGEAQGTLGDAGCYSFYATKSITTSEGGMLVTDDDELAETARKLRLAGVNKDAWEREDTNRPSWHYDVQAVSGKYNMTDVQASIGIAQLDRLDGFIERRRAVADELDARLADVDGVEPLAVRDADEHARHLYPITVDPEQIGRDRDAFDRALTAEGFGTSVHYIPIHRHTAFADLDRTDLSTVDDVAARLLCLPLHPEMTDADVDDLVTALRKVAEN
ncbi:DegT/DnrJ/EryC1/StrS family aminotransferase [Haloarchaeobius litoreus]|uniref:DegT/DnrJ/EryC1/StrS family aminotransferase n=1 Tax=Haloarchaeobius litoreus TaxID=755306 RepID=A0ABD6DLV6_9EURY|nr:DegT/DnrJ/EryC1/StrS family aminotransferase [Haloarchaeobius litoreus]